MICVAAYLIYSKWDEAPTNWDIWSEWQWISVIVLSVIGFLIEVFMWWLPANRISSLSFSKAVKNTLTFQYFHLFAPSGVSEISARYLQFPEKHHRRKSLEITALLQSSKWISRLLLAGIGLLSLDFPWLSPSLAQTIGFALITIGILLPLLVYFPSPWKKLLKDKWLGRLDRWLPFTSAGKFPIFSLIFLSTLKVLTYSTAFALLIHPVGSLDSSMLWNNLSASWAFYFVMGFLPSLGFAEGLVKGAAGLVFFSHWELSDYRIAASIFLIWCLNKGAPGIIGGITSLFKFHK